MGYEPFSIVDVEVDEHNPRFAEPVLGQREAINALLAQGPAKLLNLAEDIAVLGQLDPINPPIVMREGNRVVVLEGNRRFAALKLLRNPDIAIAPATQKALARIRKKAIDLGQTGEGPGQVDCYVVDDRDAAQRWIELRHTGQNDGVGTDPWNSYQSAAFRPRPTAEYRAVLFVRKVLTTFADDNELINDVRSVRDGGKFTNLARLLSRPYVRSQMMIDIKNDVVTLDPENNLTNDILRVVFHDLTTIKVDAIKTGDQQDDYIDEVVAAVSDRHRENRPDDEAGTEFAGEREGAPTSREQTNGAARGGSGDNQEKTSDPHRVAGGSQDEPTRRRKNAPKGEARIFYGLVLKHVDLRTSKLLKEAQKLKIDDAAGVTAVMVRVILEMAMTDIGTSRGWFTEGAKLRSKFRKSLLALDPDAENSQKRDKALDMAWIKTQSGDGDGLAVDEMNAYVHNFMAVPTPDAVRALTTTFRPLLQRLDDFAGANPA
ncbi:ParB/Srx family N-terminal domain-containing protein [Microbacterium sp. SL75]|uniref:ParB/Srx family N-terminal domain-containing protein n=1 Tax=Microbacterium sp. SL75 TaxID=2995140 RepID=UPI00226D4668|nr:ParB/Srx family N-terminal domain-containing protein [Microbacterium sp. SL75]WAC70566.1 ParB/Srx family N-terminal domain-containing protein [Microbacterium sp. SL75]